MSWLSSVNNLLENLDGQAETVAETVAEQATSAGISNNLRRLNNTIANNASALTNNITNRIDEEDDYYDDNSEISSFDDDGFGDDEEFTTDEEDDGMGVANSNEADTDGFVNDAPVVTDPDEFAAAPTSSPVQMASSTELLKEAEAQESDTVSALVEVENDGKLDSSAFIAVANQLSSHSPPEVSDDPKTTANKDYTENLTAQEKETEQIQKQQKDETRLLRKQQQQHQQVLASKNKTIQSLESQLAKLGEELTRGATEHEKLNQRTKDLNEKLKSSEREIEAQATELSTAAEQMEKIRTNAKEEREDLLDDHEDEMEEIRKNHQSALDKMRQDYEKTIAEWKERFASEESLRQQEGGDSIKELQEANKREREALIKLAEITDERNDLQTKLDQVVGQETTLKQQVESSLESAETVAAREQRARDELDEAATIHAKQMAQRQRREAELEQTILEMGSALTLAKRQLQQQSLSSPGGKAAVVPTASNQQEVDGTSYKEQVEQVAEELENVQVRLTMETQRREALQQELSEVSKERNQELSLSQARQQQHDRKVTDLESTIHRLQDSIRASKQQSDRATDDSFDLQVTDTQAMSSQELDAAKQEISNLSEQLYRQQVLAKNAKSEVLALKGRLQAANARADEAEKAQYDSKYSSQTRSRGTYDVEGGGASNSAPAFTARRRVKGGSRGVRSIRSALPCIGSGRGTDQNGAAMEQVALTIDAIDSWMVDTGSFMRHEPFARLGLLLYLMILHFWSFALVVFHTTEVEHGDFGSMDSNPRHWREHT